VTASGDGGSDGGGYASPPCFLHEVDPAYSGLAADRDPDTWRDVTRWRKATRERLLATRLALASDARRSRTEALADRLAGRLARLAAGTVVSLYWPIRGEPDLRSLAAELIERGIEVALPVAARPPAPLSFRRWRPGAALVRGIWNIPVPADDAPVRPDVVIAPVVGFDPACYRLGFGGGYFDRTLATLSPRPLAIGVGFREAALATLYPQPHDVPMDAIVTDTETLERAHTGADTLHGADAGAGARERGA
jgi:5,10-methenyltetrahydrofolate synthetase